MAPQNILKGITPRLIVLTAVVSLVCVGLSLGVVSFRSYIQFLHTKQNLLDRICDIGLKTMGGRVIKAIRSDPVTRTAALHEIALEMESMVPDLAHISLHGLVPEEILFVSRGEYIPRCLRPQDHGTEGQLKLYNRISGESGDYLVCCRWVSDEKGEPIACAQIGIEVETFPGFLLGHLRTDIFWVLIAILSATLLSAAIIALLTRPLRSVASYAHAIERGELHEKILITGHDEASTIAEALNLVLNRLRQSYVSTLAALATLLETKDPSTESHSMRGVGYALELGKALGLSEQELMDLEYGAYLHDIGKVGVDDSILKKTGSLTEEDWRIMRQHPAIGYAVLKNLEFLQNALPVVLYHQERFDGKGYPHGVKGEEIPLLARIFSIADAFDAMTTNRPYRQALRPDVAIEEIKRNSGGQFDPHLAQVFVKLWERGKLDNVKGQPGIDILSEFNAA